MSYVIGIDPSITSTGVCVLHSDRPPRLYTVGQPKSSAPKSLGSRLWHLQCSLLTAAVPTGTRPLLAAIETPISPLALSRGMGGGGFNTNIMAYAIAYEMLGKNRIPYIEVSPMQRAMIATGKGNAKKEDVVKAWDGLRIESESIKVDHNQIDAFFIAMAAAEVAVSQGLAAIYEPFTGWLNLDDRIYDMLEKLEIQEP